MSSRLALLALMILPLAACEGTGFNLGQNSESEASTGPRPPAVSPLEQPIETGAGTRPVSTAERVTYNTAAFSARGNEPFWAVDVAGNTAMYKTPENQRGSAVRVDRITFAEGVEFIGVRSGRPFALNIRSKQCRDSMSGDRFPMTAVLTTAGRQQTGCAGPATAEVAAAVAAIRAPVPAAPKAAATRSSTRPAAPRPAATPAPAAETSAPAQVETPASNAATESSTSAPATTPAPTTTPTTPSTPPAPESNSNSSTTTTTTKPSVPAPTMVLPSTPPSTGASTSTENSDDTTD
ncbi:hypothetical protein H4P12_09490 [Paracoccus sp. 11-3]|uniref:Uncharacterized protein n=1 Tax=Paracoccus amoyensis TaxID=2760093 RepID=A0A926GD54_9RHOB|nr:hypothetical protein [Paracoccus amoyensis]MBC9246945.1 hypothetical protein [Paracoccus amoyensis]